MKCENRSCLNFNLIKPNQTKNGWYENGIQPVSRQVSKSLQEADETQWGSSATYPDRFNLIQQQFFLATNNDLISRNRFLFMVNLGHNGWK